MRRAIEVARGNPVCPFGAVLVDADTLEVVCQGLNRTQASPVRHGEIEAIERCATERPGVEWSKLWLYTTAEPCCMCQGAILWAGIRRVIFGTSIETLRKLGWKQIEIPAAEVVRRTPEAQCELISAVLERECDDLFRAALERRELIRSDRVPASIRGPQR
ncbi:MAG: nucleoside deaminase [Planctomycetes bacterium]|nr:nucleoside deaminase [Planctomycetota bacterium]